MTVEITQLGRTFGSKTVVKDISFQANPGEIIGLLGTSGCGKSTVLRAISGLDDGYDGTVAIDGNKERKVKDTTGFIFQEPRLLPWQTVLANVTFGLKGTKAEKKAKAREFLELVGLAGNEHLYPRELSGGMAQRVAIARALVTSPEVLLLDEPFSALDAFTKMQLQDLLLQIWEEYHTTILLVTHDIDEALYLCDRIIVLKGQPGHIDREITVTKPRPRERGDASLAHKKEEILECLELRKTAPLQQVQQR